MKTLSLLIALTLVADAFAASRLTARRGFHSTASLQQQQPQRQVQRVQARSVAQRDTSAGLQITPAAWAAPAAVSPQVQAFRAQHCPNTDFNNLDSTPNESVFLKVPQFQGCIAVHCDADLNRNQILDIDEYVGVGQECTGQNTVTGRPYDQQSCTAAGAIWVIDYSQTGSGYIQSGSCYLDTFSNRQNVFSRLECNISRVPSIADPEPSQTTTVHNTERLCVLNPDLAAVLEQRNDMTVPDTRGIINGEVHQDCLSAYWLYSNPFFYRGCTNAGVTNYECVRDLANRTAGSTVIGGESRTCGEQLDDYFNRP